MIGVKDIQSFSTRVADSTDVAELPIFSFNTLDKIERCPTYGVVSGLLHRTMAISETSLALEAGSACHQGFAAIRIRDAYEQGEIELALQAQQKLITDGERDSDLEDMLAEDDDDFRMHLRRAYVLEVFDRYGFLEDPRDKRRTINNLSNSLGHVVEEWPWGKYAPGVLPKRLWEGGEAFNELGIEYKFALRIDAEVLGHKLAFVVVGLMDGIHIESRGAYVPHENKTSSKLDEGYIAGQRMSYQHTTYIVALNTILDHLGIEQTAPCQASRLIAVSIPLPKGYGQNFAYANELMHRTDAQFQDWVVWIVNHVYTALQFVDDPMGAPKNTHSCYRFFRACPLLPLCHTDQDERLTVLDEMETRDSNFFDDADRTATLGADDD